MSVIPERLMFSLAEVFLPLLLVVAIGKLSEEVLMVLGFLCQRLQLLI
jgi:hypothetical protein